MSGDEKGTVTGGGVRSELHALADACLMPAFSGSAVPPWALRAVEDGLAGLCLYGHNFTVAGPSVAERVRGISESLHSVRPDVLLATDEEGGDVTRLDYLVGSRYPGNLALGRVDDEAVTAEVAAAIGADLKALGINVNLAPSVDVNSDPRNPVIGVRSFGSEPDLVSRHGAAFVRGLRNAGVAAAVKHFPGHGATVVDSHLGLPVVDVGDQEFRRRDLPPFHAAVQAGADLVMTSHVLFPAIATEPATHSRRFLVDILRTELGFTGVVITDALDMAGISAERGIGDAAVRALAAGSDLLLLGAGGGQDYFRVRAEIVRAVRDGRLGEPRVREAAQRVEALRKRLAANPAHTETGPDGASVGLAAARSALTVRGDVRLNGPVTVVELRAPANMAVGQARWGIIEHLAEMGSLAATVTVSRDGPSVEETIGQVAEGPSILLIRDAYRSEWQREWVTEFLARSTATVLVAMGMAEDLGLGTTPAICTFGAGRANARAAAERIAVGR